MTQFCLPSINTNMNSSPYSPKHSSTSSGKFGFLLLLSGLIYVYILSSSSNFSSNPFFFPFQSTTHMQPPSNITGMDIYKDQLEDALQKASMQNKTLIIAVVNKAYVERDQKEGSNMFDIFLESFWLGEEDTRWLLKHMLVVTMDQTAHDRCLFRGLHCYKLETEGVDFGGEKLYMSEEFIKMMWRRTEFLLDVLKRGYNFIFTDTDVMWLRNPFTKLSNNQTLDLQISIDDSINKFINTGFYYIRSNNKTIALFETWYGKKETSKGQKEQDVLLGLMGSGIFQQLNLNVKLLDSTIFSGFCQDSNDMEAVTTVHANCCRYISAKVKDLLAVLGDWERYHLLKVGQRPDVANAIRNFKWTGHWGCWNSWRPSNNTAN